MRQDLSTIGKSKPELVQMVTDLASRIYRLEREKSLLRRSLEMIRQGLNHYDLPSFPKKAKGLINEVLAKTDARRRKHE